MIVSQDTKLDYDDVLIVPQRTKTASRKEIQVNREFKFYHSTRVWNGTPIMAANMFATGSFKMAQAMSDENMIGCLHKHHEPSKVGDFYTIPNFDKQFTPSLIPAFIPGCWFSMGIKDDDIDKLGRVIFTTHTHPNICIDVANGYTDDFVNFCAKVRQKCPDSIIMAGNVCTPEQTQELILHGGVDIVKVGIGPGSACTTRLVTGVGYPQLSAVMECAHAAHGLKSEERHLGLICADGGCVHPGDVCKAFCANADFVMLGGMLAGCDECDGEWMYKDVGETCISYRLLEKDDPDRILGELSPKHSLQFYGMSSHEAQKKHNGGVSKYRSSEGRVKEVPYKGPVKDTLQQILGGIRSCCAYIGAKNIKDMGKCARFVKVRRPHYNTEL